MCIIGYKTGIISKYSDFAEEEQIDIPFLKYDSNIAIKNIENNVIVMVWGKNAKIQIVYFNATDLN